MTITEFLLARIAEDEAVARNASPGDWTYGTVDSVAGGMVYDETRAIASLHYEQPTDHDGSIVRHLLSDEADHNGTHIARHSPARMLAECAAKRRIVDLLEDERQRKDIYNRDYDGGLLTTDNDLRSRLSSNARWAGLDSAARALAAVYKDHPGYDPEWDV